MTRNNFRVTGYKLQIKILRSWLKELADCVERIMDKEKRKTKFTSRPVNYSLTPI